MRFLITILLAVFGILLMPKTLLAQSNDEIDKCEIKIPLPYVSDGQAYLGQFSDEDYIQFDVVFFRNVKYRIMLCEKEYQYFYITLEDTYGNILFSGDEYNNPLFWDFTFDDTMRCYIKLHKSDKNYKAEYGAIAIGYEQNKPKHP